MLQKCVKPCGLPKTHKQLTFFTSKKLKLFPLYNKCIYEPQFCPQVPKMSIYSVEEVTFYAVSHNFAPKNLRLVLIKWRKSKVLQASKSSKDSIENLKTIMRN